MKALSIWKLLKNPMQPQKQKEKSIDQIHLNFL